MIGILKVWGYLEKPFENLKSQEAVESIEHLQEIVLDQLQNGVALFYFKKKDGTIRRALGTLRADLLPKKEGSGEAGGIIPKTKSTTSQAFYDLQAMAWKAYNVESLLACIEL